MTSQTKRPDGEPPAAQTESTRLKGRLQRLREQADNLQEVTEELTIAMANTAERDRAEFERSARTLSTMIKSLGDLISLEDKTKGALTKAQEELDDAAANAADNLGPEPDIAALEAQALGHLRTLRSGGNSAVEKDS